MKNFFKVRIAPLFGIIALVAAIGFSMIGCDFFGSNNSDGSEDENNGGNGGGGGTNRTITIRNNTGYGLVQCLIKPSTSSDWNWESNFFPYSYVVSLENGESRTITLTPKIANNSVYDFRVTSSAGNFTKYHTTLTSGMTLTYTQSDYDDGNQNPRITIKNLSGVDFNSVYVKPSSATDWGKNFGSVSNNLTNDFTLPFLLTYFGEFDIQLRSTNPTNTYTKTNVTVSDGMILTYYHADADDKQIVIPVAVIQNNTGYGLIQCYIRLSSSQTWGANLFPYSYVISLDNNESRTVTLPASIPNNSICDIRVTSSAGDYIRTNISLTFGMIINFAYTDLEQ